MLLHLLIWLLLAVFRFLTTHSPQILHSWGVS